MKYAHIRAIEQESIKDVLVEEGEYKEATEEEGMGPEAFFAPYAQDVEFVQWVEMVCDDPHKLPGTFGE